MKHSGICITSLVGGMVVGAVVAMLLTPQSGPDLRHKIKDWADDEINTIKQQAKKVQQRIDEQIDAARCKCNTAEE